jgi:hypothetical protein
MRGFVRFAWVLIFFASAGLVGWYAVNHVEGVREAWAEIRGERPPTWGDVGAKIQEFMDQQPIIMPERAPPEPVPAPPPLTPAP